MTRVLGVDPGLTRCGIGVVEGAPGRPVRMVEVAVIRTPAAMLTPRRLLALQTEMDAWMSRHRPDAVAIERVFADVNVASVMGTAQASAVAMLCAASRGIPIHLHTPTEVKAAVTGNGRADKAQVTAMVTQLLRLPAPPRPADAADALAVAICHLWRGRGEGPDRCRPRLPADGHGVIASVRGKTRVEQACRRIARNREKVDSRLFS